MKKGRDIEAMLWQLYGAEFPCNSQSRDPHPSGLEVGYEVGIYAVVAEVARFNRVDTVYEAELRAREKPDWMKIVKRRKVARAARQRAL
jgi:hypothetical protein